MRRKNTKFTLIRCVLSSWKCAKTRFRPGLCPDPTGGAYNAPPEPL